MVRGSAFNQPIGSRIRVRVEVRGRVGVRVKVSVRVRVRVRVGVGVKGSRRLSVGLIVVSGLD